MAIATGRARWPTFLLAFAGITIFGWMVTDRIVGTAPVPVAGWEGLSLCSYVASLDGAKTLILEETHHVILEDGKNPKGANDRDQNKTIDGMWSFDEESKRYAITLNGATTVYSVVQWENSTTCLLIKGDLTSANLHESWFSQNEDDEPDTRDRD